MSLNLRKRKKNERIQTENLDFLPQCHKNIVFCELIVELYKCSERCWFQLAQTAF